METVPRYIINGEQDNLPLWNVVITGYFAVITTSVRARSTLDAETLAYGFVEDYYDMSLASFHTEARKLGE